jgi:hypothetical protein
MQDSRYGLPRIPLPRTWVHKAKKKCRRGQKNLGPQQGRHWRAYRGPGGGVGGSEARKRVLRVWAARWVATGLGGEALIQHLIEHFIQGILVSLCGLI